MKLHTLFNLCCLLVCVALVLSCAAPAGNTGGEAAPAAEEPTLRVMIPDQALAQEPEFSALLARLAGEAGMKLEIAELSDYGVMNPDNCPDCCRGYPLPLSKDLDLFKDTDLFLIDTQSARHILGEGGLEPIPTAVVTPLLPLKEAFTKDGQLYSVPLYTRPLIVIGNKQVLEKAGINPDQLATWSWDQMIEIVSKLSPKSSGDGPVVDNLVILPSDGATFMIASCQSLLGEECTETLLFDDSEALTKAMDLVGKTNTLFQQKNVMTVREANGRDSVVEQFQRGNVALMIGYTDLLANLPQEEQNFQIVIGRFPKIDDQHGHGGVAMGMGWVIPDSSNHKSEALDLVTRLAKDEKVLSWMMTKGLFPGMLPDKAEDIEQLTLLMEQGKFGKNAMTANWKTLLEIAKVSKAWQIPENVDIDKYNSDFAPLVDSVYANWLCVERYGVSCDGRGFDVMSELQTLQKARENLK